MSRQNSARLDDPREIEELIVLPERLLARTLGRALKDSDGIADALDHLRAARGEFFRRKNFSAGEYRLCARQGAAAEPDRQTEDRRAGDACLHASACYGLTRSASKAWRRDAAVSVGAFTILPHPCL